MSKTKIKTETDCQTDITVNPPILDEDQVAQVCTQVGCQTSLIFQPDDSLTVVMPELTRYVSHDKVFQSLVVDGKIVFDHPHAAVTTDDEGEGEEGDGEDGETGFVEGLEAGEGTVDQPPADSQKPTGGDFLANMSPEEFEKNVQKILDNTVKNVYEFMAKIVEMYEKSKDPAVFAEMLRRQQEGILSDADEEEGEEEESEEEIEDETSRRKRAYEYLEKCLNGEIPEDRFEVTDNGDGTKIYRIKNEDDTEVVLEEKLEIRSIKGDEDEDAEAAPKDDNFELSEKLMNIHKGALPEDQYTEVVNPDGTKSFRLKMIREKKFEIVETVDIISPRKPEKRRTRDDEALEEGEAEEGEAEEGEGVLDEEAILDEEVILEEAPSDEGGDQMGDTQNIRQPIEIECECGKVHDAGAAPPILTVGDKKLRLEFKMDGPKSIEETLDGMKVKATISNTNQTAPADKTIVVSFNLGDPKDAEIPLCKCRGGLPDDICSCISSDNDKIIICDCDPPKKDESTDCTCSEEDVVVDTPQNVCCTCAVPTSNQQTASTKVPDQCVPTCIGKGISSNLAQSLREQLTEKTENYSCQCGKTHSANCLGKAGNTGQTGYKTGGSLCSCESTDQKRVGTECSCDQIQPKICDNSVDKVVNTLKQQSFKDPQQLDQHLKGLQPLLRGISMQSYVNTSSQKCVCVSSVQVIYKKSENVNKACDCDMRIGIGIGTNPDAPPLYQRDTDYQEGYYDEFDVDNDKTAKGINSLPDVYNESTRCGDRTELPWMKMALPPPGTIQIKKVKKKKCDCQQKVEEKARDKLVGLCCTCDIIPKPDKAAEVISEKSSEGLEPQQSTEHHPDCPCYNPALNCADIKPQKQTYDGDNNVVTEDYMRELLSMYPDDDGICDDKPEINWADYSLPTNVKLGSVCGDKLKSKRRKDICIQNCGEIMGGDAENSCDCTGQKCFEGCLGNQQNDVCDCFGMPPQEPPQMYQAQMNQPQMNQGAPQMYQGGPQMNQGVPQMYQGGPQMYQGGPQMNQGVPQMYQGAQQPSDFDENPSQDGTGMLRLELKFSEYTEIVSTLMPVEGGAEDQATVSQFSTISDVTKTLKRMDQEFVNTELKSGDGYAKVGTVGSAPFNVQMNGNSQAVSMPQISDRNSDIVNVVNYGGFDSKSKREGSAGFSGGGLGSNLPFDVNGRKAKSASFTYNAKKRIEAEVTITGQIPLPFDDQNNQINQNQNKNQVNNQNNNQNGFNMKDRTGVCTCSGQKCIETCLGKQQDVCLDTCKRKKSNKLKIEESDSNLNRLGSPILAAIKTVQKEMKPLHDTLNELKMKIQSMDIPELDNWKKDDQESCSCNKNNSKSKSKKRRTCTDTVNILFPEVFGPFNQKQYVKDKNKLKENESYSYKSNESLMSETPEKDSKNNANSSYCVCLENVEDDEENKFKKIVDETMGFEKMVIKDFDFMKTKDKSLDDCIEKAMMLDHALSKHVEVNNSQDSSFKSSSSHKSSNRQIQNETKPIKLIENNTKMNTTTNQINQNFYNYNMYVEWFYSNYYNLYSNYYTYYPQYPVTQSQSNHQSKTIIKSSRDFNVTKQKTFKSFTSIETVSKSSRSESESYPTSKSSESSDFMDSLTYDDEESKDEKVIGSNEINKIEDVGVENKSDDLKCVNEDSNEKSSSFSSSF
ncbi:uncharacterized protein [Onthophagus taurus]|uniref:uncharacterized protein n=1 Tax=Onthophagus taurus TaxID=166361 RepID=UPI0039BE13F8